MPKLGNAILGDRFRPPWPSPIFFPFPRVFNLARSLAAAAFPPAESEASARSTTHQRRAPHASGASCATPERARPPQRARYRANANCPRWGLIGVALSSLSTAFAQRSHTFVQSRRLCSHQRQRRSPRLAPSTHSTINSTSLMLIYLYHIRAIIYRLV